MAARLSPLRALAAPPILAPPTAIPFTALSGVTVQPRPGSGAGQDGVALARAQVDLGPPPTDGPAHDTGTLFRHRRPLGRRA